MLFLDDPAEAITKILLEFNEKLPKYRADKETEAFTIALFGFLSKGEKSPDEMTDKEKKAQAKVQEKIKEDGSKTLALGIGQFMHVYKQPYSEILNLTLETYIELNKYIPKILGGETEEEKNTADKKGIKELMQSVALPIDNKF